MGNLTIATMFIVFVNVLMWFSQIAMIEINPYGTVCYNPTGSVIGNTITRDITTGAYNTSVINNDILNQIPGAANSNVAPSGSGGFVTDLFNNILGWFKSIPGVNYVINVVGAPYNILKCLNLPVEFVVGIGTLWYLVSLLIFLSYIWWRD